MKIQSNLGNKKCHFITSVNKSLKNWTKCSKLDFFQVRLLRWEIFQTIPKLEIEISQNFCFISYTPSFKLGTLGGTRKRD